VAQHHSTGSETSPSYAPRSSRFGSEPPSVQDDVDTWRYAIVSCTPETTTTMFMSVCACLSVYMCPCLRVLVCDWSTNDVCAFLRDLDLGEHCDSFIAHDIRGRELLTLGRTDLKVSTCCQSPIVCSVLNRFKLIKL